jgi:AcrR family transcriptional regulator
MPRPTGTAKKSGDSNDIVERILKAAMETAERLGWRRATLTDIADAAGVSLAELHAHFGDKAAILRGLADLADRKVLEGLSGKPEPGTSARDRLFDVLMARFEALKPYRRGLAVVAREGGGSIVDVLCGAQRMLRSFAWMLEAAGIGSGGWSGACRVKGLALVYGSTFATWLRDDTEDMAKTMAALDRNLARAERFANTFGFRRPGTRPEAEAASEGSPA